MKLPAPTIRTLAQAKARAIYLEQRRALEREIRELARQPVVVVYAPVAGDFGGDE
jgi:hypothetical protein